MTAALERLEATGFFAQIRENVVLFVSSTDNDEAFDLENRSAKELNPEPVYLSFLDRFPPRDTEVRIGQTATSPLLAISVFSKRCA